MVKLAVVGSQTFFDRAFMHRALDKFHFMHGVTLVVSGGAKGADTIGERWAQAEGIKTLIHYAKWNEGPQTNTRMDGSTYNRAAGHIRNEFIVRDCDVVIAFVSDWAISRGTKNTVDVHVKAMGKPCFLYDAKYRRWTQNDAATAWLAVANDTPIAL